MDRAKADRYFRKMLRIVNRNEIVGLTGGIYLGDNDRVFPRVKGEAWIKWLKKAYFLCFQQYLIELCRYFAKNYPGERISIAMEDNEDLYPVAAECFLVSKHSQDWPNHVLLETIAPYSKVDAPNLQTADILAYEVYLMQTRKRFNPEQREPRKSLLSLINNKIVGRCWDEAALLHWRGEGHTQ